MPSGMAGLTRYFEEAPEAVRLKPQQVVVMAIGLIALEAFLYFML